jgi:hypothetical protein
MISEHLEAAWLVRKRTASNTNLLLTFSPPGNKHHALVISWVAAAI